VVRFYVRPMSRIKSLGTINNCRRDISNDNDASRLLGRDIEARSVNYEIYIDTTTSRGIMQDVSRQADKINHVHAHTQHTLTRPVSADPRIREQTVRIWEIHT
jgi:hypothetical protein